MTHIFLIPIASLRDKDIYLYHEYTETKRGFTAEAEYGRHRSAFITQPPECYISMLVGWLGAEGIKLNVKKLLITVLAKVSMPLASYSFVMCLLLLTFFSIFSLLWYLLGCHVNFNSLSKIVFASCVTTGKGY